MTDEPKKRVHAPDRGKDADLQFLFWECSAEIGLAAIEAKTGGRTGPKIDANPLVTRRIVRGARERAEELERMGTARQKRGDMRETAAEKVNRIMRAWGAVDLETQNVLFHAYGRREMDPQYEREENKNGAVMNNQLGRWSRVLPFTSALLDAYEAAAPLAPMAKMITRPERVMLGFAQHADAVPIEATFSRRDILPGEAACVKVPERRPLPLADWVDLLLHATNKPKGARNILEAARAEAERMVTAAWHTWNDERMKTAPRRTGGKPRPPAHVVYEREQRERDFTWHAEEAPKGETVERPRRAVVERGEL